MSAATDAFARANRQVIEIAVAIGGLNEKLNANHEAGARASGEEVAQAIFGYSLLSVALSMASKNFADAIQRIAEEGVEAASKAKAESNPFKSADV